MTTLAALVRKAGVDPDDAEHLQKLTASWGMLADLCFSDLILYVPTRYEPRTDSLGATELNYMVVAQVRPATSRTLYPRDLVSTVVSASSVPGITQCMSSGHIAFKESRMMHAEEHRVSFCIPVRRGDRLVAAMVRDYELNAKRVRGELERVYVSLFERFANMITHGDFPFDADDPAEAPRVGDGVMVLDSEGRITFMSPNAASALHRLGRHVARVGDPFEELGLDITAVTRAQATLSPVVEEVERRPDSTIMFQAIPLLDQNAYSGAMVLVRDITELRRRDRLLLSKDATIREVHHRVKNNLQTISSLLRLQIRRLDSEVGKEALMEAERRIRAMALVHEILSREVGDEVDFQEVVSAIIQLAHESVPPDLHLEIEVTGSPGELDASIATPLALALAELIQNSIEHAFSARTEGLGERTGRIMVRLARNSSKLAIEVRDTGVGFGEGFDPNDITSLGLSIVKSLITSQLEGKIAFGSGPGAAIKIEVPVDESPGQYHLESRNG